MIDPAYVQRMARYNRWQNQNLYGVADQLADDARRLERGAFFGSIHKTLNHLLWGDQVWMSRFARTPRPAGSIPDSVSLHGDWHELKRARAIFDETIIAWADGLDPAWLNGNLTYVSGAVGAELSRPIAGLVVHFFNHQTHHRGQVHCMLTQAGGKPHTTDLPGLPE